MRNFTNWNARTGYHEHEFRDVYGVPIASWKQYNGPSFDGYYAVKVVDGRVTAPETITQDEYWDYQSHPAVR